MPAVRAVLTAGDLPACVARSRIPMLVPSPFITTARTQLPLAREEVSYVGEIIAVVVAESRHAAEDGAAAVSIDFEALACGQRLPRRSGNGRCACAQRCCKQHRCHRSRLPMETLKQHLRAPLVYLKKKFLLIAARRCRWRVARSWQVTMLRAIFCRFGRRHRRRISPGQRSRTCSDAILKSIRVIAPFVGGGFGTKAPFYAEEAVIPAAAMQLNCPVTWQEDRREHFLSATQERDQHWQVAVAVDAEGKILGLRGSMLHDTGAFLPWGIIAPYIAATTVPGPYVVPAYRLDLTIALTNRVPTTVVRGAGRPQAVFAMERLVDRIARELGLDRAEVRRRNMVRPEQMPYAVGLLFRDGKPLVYGSGDFPKCLERALSLAAYDEFRSRQVSARAEGRYIGIGIGNYVEGTGLGPFEGVTVRVLPNGKVAVATGATSQGQGTITTLSQIVADAVGCRLEDILMTTGDTAAISQGVGAFASRQAVNAGSSARIAGASVGKQVVALAARTFDVPEDRDRCRGRPRDRTHRKQTIHVTRAAGARGSGHARLLLCAGPGARVSSTPHISRRPRPHTAMGRMWPKSKSIRSPAA